MSLKNKALTGIFWSGIQQFGSQLISFIVSIFLARLLSPSEFGLVAMILVFIAISQTIIDSGLSQSLIRMDHPTTTDYSTIFYFNIFSSIGLYGLLFIIAPQISRFYNEESLIILLRVLGLIIIIKSLFLIQLTKLTKEMNFKLQAYITIPTSLASGLISIFLALSGFGIWSIIFYRLSSEFINGILIWYFVKWRPRFVFSFSDLKYHFKFGINLMFASIIDTVFRNIYTLIIGKYFLSAQLGFFNRASSFQRLPVQSIGRILNKVTFPLFSEIKDDNLRLKNIYMILLRQIMFIISPILIFMGVLAEPIVIFLFTEKWLPMIPYLRILLIGGILYPIHSYNLNILKVKGRSDLFLKLEIIKKIIIIISIIIGMQWGVIGLAWSTVFTSFSALFINTHYSTKMIGLTLSTQLKNTLPSLLLAILSGIVVYYLSMFLDNKVNNFSGIMIMGLAGTLIYLTSTFLFKVKALSEFIDIFFKNNDKDKLTISSTI